MFGKKSRMSTNDRAVMAAGRANGNLPRFGGSKGGKGGSKGKETPDPFKPRTLKVGKNSGFDAE